MRLLEKHFTPTQISRIYIGAAIVGIFGVSVGIMKLLEPEKRTRTERPQIENIITAEKGRKFGLDALSGKVVVLEKNLAESRKEVENLSAENEELLKNSRESQALAKELSSTQKELKQLKSQFEVSQQNTKSLIAETVDYQLNERDVNNILNPGNKGEESTDNAKTSDSKLPINPSRRKVKNSQFSYGNNSTQDNAEQQTAKVSDDANRQVVAPSRNTELFTIIEAEKPKEEKTKNEIYLPKGSILTGVLITGLDAPTASDAKSSPIPALVRLKKEAILPNYAVVEQVRECFAIVAGYGDLSSERAFFRGESITCVRKDKSVIEVSFKSFAVGEDGKNGLKGTLVTRNSTVLANAMMAGFASGLSSMFNVNPVPVISTSSDGSQQYQDVFNASAVQGGAAKGASDAMNRLADYYMQLADAIHPVIEIGAGRVVDMVVTEGATL